MNKHMSNFISRPPFRNSNGVTMLEVLLGIVIFVVGMLALAHLQGNLARSSTDANARTVAASIAEETVEAMRAFEQISTAAGKVAYEDIKSKTVPVTRGGVEFTVDAVVQDFYFLGDNYNQTVSKTAPTGVKGSDFKYVEVNVSWEGQGFQGTEGNTQTADRLGSGIFMLSSIIPAIPSLNNAKVAAEDDGALGAPPVNYTPGVAPDVVKLSVGNEKFKEASKPIPDLVKGGTDSVETWFDVIIYDQATLGSEVFLRREEFLAVSCECKLQVSGGSGRTPTTWNGYGYTEGKVVPKNSGVAADNQSNYCDVCCADHHDGANISNGDDKSLNYGPSSGSTSADHAHWGFGKTDDTPPKVAMIEITTDEGAYLEACRLVRVDGFMRVAQDLDQHGFYAFPECYLESDDGSDYGEFVGSAAESHYENIMKTGSEKPMPQPEDVGYIIPASTGDDRTNLPTVPSVCKLESTEDQQMQSRGVYLDYLTAEAQANIDKCFDNDAATACINPAITAADLPALMYPFFDVQLTWLGRWNVAKAFIGDPVDVTNGKLESGNAHDRGRAFLFPKGSKMGQSEVIASSHTGNLGLTGTGEIDEDYEADTVEKTVFVTASGDIAPYPTSGTEFSGKLSSSWNPIKPADFVITPSPGVYCGQTDISYICIVTPQASDPTIELSNYGSGSMWGCSRVLGTVTPGTTTTVFSLPVAGGNRRDADIWAQKGACP